MSKPARYITLLFLCLYATGSYAQVTPKVPTLGEELPFSHGSHKTPSQPQLNTYIPAAIPQPNVASQPSILNFSQPLANPHNPSATGTNASNAELIKEAIEYEVYENDKRQRSEAAQILTERGFLSLAEEEGTASYYSAFEELLRMLKGDQSLSLERAVFLVENAYYDNAIPYENYQAGLSQSINFCEAKAAEDKLDLADNMAKNLMIFRYITDTLELKDRQTSRTLVHNPIQYDYDDYQSLKSYDSHFVTTLMRTGKGQCYSMPLYYLILAERMGTEAYWSFSPKHSFIKLKDEENSWYNIELTCKSFLSDPHYMNSSYIKVEAIQNRIYLEPIDKKDAVANMLLSLARGYWNKYGYDDFYLKCVNTAASYLPDEVDPLILQAAYQTRLTLTIANLLGAKNPTELEKLSPEAYQHHVQMLALYDKIDNLGYEELPEELYAQWLKYLEGQKEKAERMPTIFLKNLNERR